MNVGHCYPGTGDMDTIGSPLKYSMCLAENVAENPWDAFHVERGLEADQSAVTIFGTNDVIHMGSYQRDAEQLLMAWASRAAVAGHANPLIPSRFEFDENHAVMLMAPDHARNLSQDGHTKESIRKFISRRREDPPQVHGGESADLSRLRARQSEVDLRDGPRNADIDSAGP